MCRKLQLILVSGPYLTLSALISGLISQIIFLFDTNEAFWHFFQGKLLKPGEEATSYSDMEDDDEEASNNESADKKNDWIKMDWIPSDECCVLTPWIEWNRHPHTLSIPQKVQCAQVLL